MDFLVGRCHVSAASNIHLTRTWDCLQVWVRGSSGFVYVKIYVYLIALYIVYIYIIVQLYIYMHCLYMDNYKHIHSQVGCFLVVILQELLRVHHHDAAGEPRRCQLLKSPLKSNIVTQHFANFEAGDTFSSRQNYFWYLFIKFRGVGACFLFWPNVWARLSSWRFIFEMGRQRLLMLENNNNIHEPLIIPYIRP